MGLFAGQKQAPKDARIVERVIARHLAAEKTETICNEVSSGIDHFKNQLVIQMREAPKLIKTTKPKKHKQSEINMEEILTQTKQQIETMKRNIFKQVKGFTIKLNNTFANKLENKITIPVKVPKPFDPRELDNQKGRYFDELKESNKEAKQASKFIPTKRPTKATNRNHEEKHFQTSKRFHHQVKQHFRQQARKQNNNSRKSPKTIRSKRAKQSKRKIL